jgi:IMP dehydrogenase
MAAMSQSPFDRINEQPALTFDDVMLIPAASNLTIEETNLKTKLSQNIALNLPFIFASANATLEQIIFMAQIGGIGVVPAEKSVSQQADKVIKVKKFQARIVRDVVTVSVDTPIVEALEVFQRYDFPGIPVTDADRGLAGMIMRDSLQNIEDVMQPVSNLMIKDVATVIGDKALEDGHAAMKQKNIPSIVVLDKKKRIVGMITQGDKDKLDANPLATIDDDGRLRVVASVGAGPDHYDRIGSLIDAGADALYIDALHGHNKTVLDTVTYIRRQRAGHVDVIAGNVATQDGANALIDAGANAIRAGFIMQAAGVGVPDLSALMAVVDASMLQHIPVIATSGINHPGDAPKAIAAGASSILLNNINRETLDILSNALRMGMTLTGCATLATLQTAPRFIRAK